VAIVFGPRYVLSFQERVGDVFDAVRDRLRKSKGRIRKAGPDYLAYSLIDAIVDNYFIILERLDMSIEDLEDVLLVQPTVDNLKRLQALKGDLIFMRKNLWPMREMVARLERGESSKFKKETHVYLRDLSDHTIQVLETVESFRDVLSSLMDIYLSSVSNRMNEVMKVLTIIATIFIPLTFVVGVYGMNFDYMPELGWRWAYFAVWGVMIAIGLGLFAIFRRRKWL
jgi:magnesium transporter